MCRIGPEGGGSDGNVGSTAVTETITVNVERFRNRLREHLEILGSGVAILVTRRGKVVARVLPPDDLGGGLGEKTDLMSSTPMPTRKG